MARSLSAETDMLLLRGIGSGMDGDSYSPQTHAFVFSQEVPECHSEAEEKLLANSELHNHVAHLSRDSPHQTEPCKVGTEACTLGYKSTRPEPIRPRNAPPPIQIASCDPHLSLREHGSDYNVAASPDEVISGVGGPVTRVTAASAVSEAHRDTVLCQLAAGTMAECMRPILTDALQSGSVMNGEGHGPEEWNAGRTACSEHTGGCDNAGVDHHLINDAISSWPDSWHGRNACEEKDRHSSNSGDEHSPCYPGGISEVDSSLSEEDPDTNTWQDNTERQCQTEAFQVDGGITLLNTDPLQERAAGTLQIVTADVHSDFFSGDKCTGKIGCRRRDEKTAVYSDAVCLKSSAGCPMGKPFGDSRDRDDPAEMENWQMSDESGKFCSAEVVVATSLGGANGDGGCEKDGCRESRGSGPTTCNMTASPPGSKCSITSDRAGRPDVTNGDKLTEQIRLPASEQSTLCHNAKVADTLSDCRQCRQYFLPPLRNTQTVFKRRQTNCSDSETSEGILERRSIYNDDHPTTFENSTHHSQIAHASHRPSVDLSKHSLQLHVSQCRTETCMDNTGVNYTSPSRNIQEHRHNQSCTPCHTTETKCDDFLQITNDSDIKAGETVAPPANNHLIQSIKRIEMRAKGESTPASASTCLTRHLQPLTCYNQQQQLQQQEAGDISWHHSSEELQQEGHKVDEISSSSQPGEFLNRKQDLCLASGGLDSVARDTCHHFRGPESLQDDHRTSQSHHCGPLKLPSPHPYTTPLYDWQYQDKNAGPAILVLREASIDQTLNIRPNKIDTGQLVEDTSEREMEIGEEEVGGSGIQEIRMGEDYNSDGKTVTSLLEETADQKLTPEKSVRYETGEICLDVWRLGVDRHDLATSGEILCNGSTDLCDNETSFVDNSSSTGEDGLPASNKHDISIAFPRRKPVATASSILWDTNLAMPTTTQVVFNALRLDLANDKKAKRRLRHQTEARNNSGGSLSNSMSYHMVNKGNGNEGETHSRLANGGVSDCTSSPLPHQDLSSEKSVVIPMERMASVDINQVSGCEMTEEATVSNLSEEQQKTVVGEDDGSSGHASAINADAASAAEAEEEGCVQERMELSSATQTIAPSLDSRWRHHACLLYHRRDMTWVQEMAIQLESNPLAFNCCQLWRDFPPETSLRQRVRYALAYCRKIVVVLSPHFLSNLWSGMDDPLLTEHDMALRHRDMVLLQLCQLEVPPLFTDLTYIFVGQNNWWAHLLMHLIYREKETDPSRIGKVNNGNCSSSGLQSGFLLTSLRSQCECCGKELIDTSVPEDLPQYGVEIPAAVFQDTLTDLMKDSKFRCHVWCYNVPVAIVIFTLTLGALLAVVPLLEARLLANRYKTGLEMVHAGVAWLCLLTLYMLIIHLAKKRMKQSTYQRLTEVNAVFARYNMLAGVENLGLADCNKYYVHIFYFEMGPCMAYLQELLLSLEETLRPGGEHMSSAAHCPHDGQCDRSITTDAEAGLATTDQSRVLGAGGITNVALQSRVKNVLLENSGEYISLFVAKKLPYPDHTRHVTTGQCLCQYVERRVVKMDTT